MNSKNYDENTQQISNDEFHDKPKEEVDFKDNETNDPTKCSICSSQIQNIEAVGMKLKCQQCLEKIASVPAGFPFKLAGDEIKEYECPICLMLIRDATELPCHHLMCKDCLDYYERDLIKKNERYDIYVFSLLYQSAPKKNEDVSSNTG